MRPPTSTSGSIFCAWSSVHCACGSSISFSSLDDVFDDVHRHLAADAVDDGLHRLAGLVVLARGGGEGILERLEHALDVDRLLVRQRLDVFR